MRQLKLDLKWRAYRTNNQIIVDTLTQNTDLKESDIRWLAEQLSRELRLCDHEWEQVVHLSGSDLYCNKCGIKRVFTVLP